ncbi:hypothetical protein B0H13DRAFT_1908198 [Mycena leptocephala]|nr:hypothetical protein B0H13DRAFT_1908198 [Mycena leptocephala]
MIPTFLRVARHRIEPLLYRVICFNGNVANPKIDSVRAAMRSKTLDFFSAVRHLSLVESEITAEEERSLLQLCKNVENLSLAGFLSIPQLLLVLARMRVRKLAVFLADLFGFPKGSDIAISPGINFGHPLFISITQLDIFDDNPASPASGGPRAAHTPRFQSWDVLSEAHSGCKKLKVLVNLCPDYCMQVAVALACATPFSDPRFVTMMSVYTDYWSNWIAGAEDGTDFWVAAEDFISRKARQVIPGKVIVSPHANHSNLYKKRGGYRGQTSKWSEVEHPSTFWLN